MEFKINTEKYDDKDILTDSLYSQKHITECYNFYANECSTDKLRDEFVSILCDEHKLEEEILKEMQKRGYLKVQNADPIDIKKAKGLFKNNSFTLIYL